MRPSAGVAPLLDHGISTVRIRLLKKSPSQEACRQKIIAVTRTRQGIPALLFVGGQHASHVGTGKDLRRQNNGDKRDHRSRMP